MAQPPRSHECVAVALRLEDVAEERALLDAATRAAEGRVLLALLGAAAAGAPTTATLDLLARCFDSSARLAPTVDVLPLFPFLHGDLSGCLEAADPAQILMTSPANFDAAEVIVAAVNAARGQRQGAPPLELTVVPPPAAPDARPPSLLASTQARVIGGWDGPLQFSTVAVGGTFDRLHAGHRLLLAATALVATRRIFVGVTSDKLLASKKNKELLEPYGAREAAAVGYMRAVNPGPAVSAGPLVDPKIPPLAATDPEFDAIVVSEETIGGAEAINEVRRGLGFAPLTVVVVGLIGGATAAGGKLSSTDLRAAAAAARPGGGDNP